MQLQPFNIYIPALKVCALYLKFVLVLVLFLNLASSTNFNFSLQTVVIHAEDHRFHSVCSAIYILF